MKNLAHLVRLRHGHDCEDGWIWETVGGARTVKDRCMICNEPPWYRARRRQRLFEMWWPLIFVVGLYGVAFIAANIVVVVFG